MATFAQRLRELREQNHMTQEYLADKVGTGKQTISQYELGKRRADHDMLLMLADVFNVSTDYLLGKSDITLRLLTSNDLMKLNTSVSEFDMLLLNAYHSASYERKAIIRDMLHLPDEEKTIIKTG